MNSSDLPSYSSISRKRYTLRLLSMCLGSSTNPLPPLPVLGVKSSPFDSLFNSLRWDPFSLALHLCFSWDITNWRKIYIKTDSWIQISHEEFGQLQTSTGKPKKLKFDGLLLSKKYILSAKTYIQRIYLSYFKLLVHQIPKFPKSFLKP